MQIILKNIAKSYNEDWIFRNLNFTFSNNTAYAILGSNGSGKSTLLKLIAGNLLPSEGSIAYHNKTIQVAPENIFNAVSIAAPYLELIDEFSLSEMLVFHTKFKAFREGLNQKEVLELMQLEPSRNKAIKHFSSGMKQRVKLALAILSDTSILLLDEPTSNLDRKGIDWYCSLVAKHATQRIVIVCSNQQIQEYAFCTEVLNVEDYK
jgi:ABC-type multidrug transport system ATPase subunit